MYQQAESTVTKYMNASAQITVYNEVNVEIKAQKAQSSVEEHQKAELKIHNV
jgi:hypothetical protein